jgi:hypothetical protein
LPEVDTDVIDPPSVMVPVVVIVPPVSVKPFIDPDVATLVTVPEPPAPLDAAVKRPCASTVILALVYEPAVTAVLARLSVRAADPSKVVPDE